MQASRTDGRELPLRHSCRALLFDPDDRLLLAAHVVDHDGGIVWACPGGGVEGSETQLQTLRRELFEETGIRLDQIDLDCLVEVWDQQVRAPSLVQGYGGVNNHYYLIRTKAFEPAAGVRTGESGHPYDEGIESFRWWSPQDIVRATREQEAQFSPRDLAVLISELLADERRGGLPTSPLLLGL